jgi:hypothetical protein
MNELNAALLFASLFAYLPAEAIADEATAIGL